MSEVPRFQNSLEGLTGAQHGLMHTHGYDLLQPKDTKQNQPSIKACGVEP